MVQEDIKMLVLQEDIKISNICHLHIIRINRIRTYKITNWK